MRLRIEECVECVSREAIENPGDLPAPLRNTLGFPLISTTEATDRNWHDQQWSAL